MIRSALVTGGAGFIGSNLALELERMGVTVTVAENFLSGHRDNLDGFGGTVIECDVSKPFAQNTFDPGHFDVVFHDGDITDPRYDGPLDVYAHNLSAFKNVVSFCQKQNAKLIYASTAGLYGNGPSPMCEDQPQELTTPYAKSKSAMDELVRSLSQSMHIVGLRYFNVFGPHEAHKGRPASMVFHLYEQMKAGNRPRLFNYGEQKRDFIYVKDVVRANLCALEASSGIYNVGTGIASSFNEVVACLNAALGTSLPPEYFDMPYKDHTYQSHTQADLTHAKKTLGFTPAWPLKKAIQDYCKLICAANERAALKAYVI